MSGVKIVRRMSARVTASEMFPHVADLEAYVAWMPLVYDVDTITSPGAGDMTPAWSVELRAQVGPFARSKRLRMERTAVEHDRLAVFERREEDEREHSAWVLSAEIGEDPACAGTTELTMTMRYDGSLWVGAVLERVLDDQVRRGSERLAALLGGDPQDPKVEGTRPSGVGEAFPEPVAEAIDHPAEPK